YRPGARNKVPLVARNRTAELICQVRPIFHTLSLPSTESYSKTRAEEMSDKDSNPGLPAISGISTSAKASRTLSSPLVTCAEVEPHRSPPCESALGWSSML